MKKELAVSGKIESKIFMIRGLQVMLDRDLAALYGVPTSRLNEAVKRNGERFPSDFMLRLTRDEWESLISQFAISKQGRGGRRTIPYAFTEHGVAMLANVLKSERAVKISIEIIRTFSAMRRYALLSRSEGVIKNRLGVLERALLSYIEKNDKRVEEIVEVLNAMLVSEEKGKQKKIGFVP